ncbi:hypothetical protein NKR23_g11664 [Pleurostoma richardsiae]|uniref:Bromo domain-containing protein n=1 Tax=Pleurostoma richardsiae TaxID=41990 RepID=A0AA38R163_9PEZI|nr:hypothetical protein NKR23_g11664 [Pleurostoma richardsiae]
MSSSNSAKRTAGADDRLTSRDYTTMQTALNSVFALATRTGQSPHAYFSRFMEEAEDRGLIIPGSMVLTDLGLPAWKPDTGSSDPDYVDTSGGAALSWSKKKRDVARHLDEETFNDEPLTQWRARELRKAITYIKNLNQSSWFREPVVVLWPDIADAYLKVVNKPMDLGTIEQKLACGGYSILREFKEDVDLVAQNSLAFNGPNHQATIAARMVVQDILFKLVNIPSEDPRR